MPSQCTVLDEIARSRAEWVAQLGAANLDGYLSIMAPDVAWLPPHGPAIAGVQALRDWLAPFLAQYRYEFSVSNVRLRVAGDWAFERGAYRSVLTAAVGGASSTHTGSYSVFWHRDANGRWRIDRYADESDLEPIASEFQLRNAGANETS